MDPDYPPEFPSGNGALNAVATTDPHFLIGAIGASAGGINALRAFFQQVPADSNMAFVLSCTWHRTLKVSWPRSCKP